MKKTKILCIFLMICLLLLSSCAVNSDEPFFSMTDEEAETYVPTEPSEEPSETKGNSDAESDTVEDAPTDVATTEEAPTDSEAVSESWKASDQSEQVSESRDISNASTDAESADPEPLPPTPAELLADIQKGFQIAELLKTEENAVLRFFNGTEKLPFRVLYYAREDGSLLIDERTNDSEGAAISAYTVKDGACYTTENELLSFAVLPDVDDDFLVRSFGYELFPSGLIAKEFVTEGDALILNAVFSRASTSANEYTEYVYTVDADTLSLRAVEISAVSFSQTVERQFITLTLNDGEYVPELFAYRAHSDAEDAVNVHACIYSRNGIRTSSYKVSATASIGAYVSADGTPFAVYKNEECTKNVTDLSFAELGEAYAFVDEWIGEISLDFSMSWEDLENFRELVENFKALAIEGRAAAKIAEANRALESAYEFIDTQTTVALIRYYSDLSDPDFNEEFILATSISGEANALLTEAYRQILVSDSPIRDLLFAGWSEEELAALTVDKSAVVVLEEQNATLLTEYLSLPQNMQWEAEVNRIYEQFVANNTAIARLSGYDNYYDYASDGYCRDYGIEEREQFRALVKEYVLPFYEAAEARFYEMRASLTSTQKEWLYALTTENYNAHLTIKRYVDEHIASFTPTLASKMFAMFEKEGVMLLGTAQGAYQGAFTTYLSRYEEPVAYFGSGFLDVLTVLHENGHYAAYCSLLANRIPSLDLCELHSQGNEWLFISSLKDQLDPTVYETFVLDRLLDGLRIIIYATIVDECEEVIYAAQTPYIAEEYDEVLNAVISSYGAYAEENALMIRQYFKMVVLNSPVYYLSYATSEMAAISLYLLAVEDEEAARTAYSELVEGVTVENGFLSSISEVGLDTPFDEATFITLFEVFGSYIDEESLLAA